MKSFLFKESMFKQIIAGNKTQTRRIINTNYESDLLNPIGQKLEDDDRFTVLFQDATSYQMGEYTAPKRLGDICYLKEPYFITEYEANNGITPEYKYLSDNKWTYKGWKNKLFMPEKYARYFIRITSIWVERLQDISEKDAIAEGIELVDCVAGVNLYSHYGTPDRNTPTTIPEFSFAYLWQSINKKAPNRWEDNPFVWVYEFELVDKSEVYAE